MDWFIVQEKQVHDQIYYQPKQCPRHFLQSLEVGAIEDCKDQICQLLTYLQATFKGKRGIGQYGLK